MNLRHPFGPEIIQVEARTAVALRYVQLHFYVMLVGIVAGLVLPLTFVQALPFWSQVVFWSVATPVFLVVYIGMVLVCIEFYRWLGKNTMQEGLALLATVLVVHPIMLGFAMLMGAEPGDWGQIVLGWVLTTIFLELGTYVYYAFVDKILFPKIYGPMRPSKTGDGNEPAVILEGTTIPVAHLETIQAQGHKTEITGAGQTVLVPKGFNLIIAQLPADLGFQIHRSIWVCRSVAARIERDDRRVHVVTDDGRRLPVARARQSQLAAWLGPKNLLEDP